MIDWLNEYCKEWGTCTRWILTDTNEGYPSADTIEKARQGMLSLTGASSRHWPEVRVNHALMIANAMKQPPHMPLELTATVWAHYVVKGRPRNKLPALSKYLGRTVSVPEYWRNVDRAHWFLAGRLTVSTESRSCTVP